MLCDPRADYTKVEVSQPAHSPCLKAAALSAAMGLSEAKAKNGLEIVLQDLRNGATGTFYPTSDKVRCPFHKGM